MEPVKEQESREMPTDKAEKLLREMTFEEKALLLTGGGSMSTCGIARLGIPAVRMADGPHGIRGEEEQNCTSFPNLCSVGASWDEEIVSRLGEALAEECIERGIRLLLAPGINMKRHILCGRNFEYLSEDPLLAGKLGAAYIRGLQSLGVGASLKHFACNNQEENRVNVSVEADLRTLREIYLKGFEIAVKEAKPASVMCAYNRLHSIWCSENRYLLTEVLREEWGYEGFVVSDWSAVHDPGRAAAAGLDLQMPKNAGIVTALQKALEQGTVSMEAIDRAALGILRFVCKEAPQKRTYDRDKQHMTARNIAAAGIVLMKNEDQVLPVTPEKYHSIAVIGEFADSPLISGQGSAEVYTRPEYIDSPLEELKKALGDGVEVRYRESYKKGAYSDTMLWRKQGEFLRFVGDSELVLIFAGSMVSEDTECFDRRSASFNPNYERLIEAACDAGKKVVVVMQTGGAMILGSWHRKVSGLVQMWLAGEGAGGAIADVLTGRVNPSGKLPETFPNRMRTDLDYPGSGNVVEYREREAVGYRYYDRHPEEIDYPFGYGLSYTRFEYGRMETETAGDTVKVSLQLRNAGDRDGAEVVQIYVGSCSAARRRAEKELKAFRKVWLRAGETASVQFTLDSDAFSYYNVLMRKWVVESGEYEISAAASSRDIRQQSRVYLAGGAPYTQSGNGRDMIG